MESTGLLRSDPVLAPTLTNLVNQFTEALSFLSKSKVKCDGNRIKIKNKFSFFS